MYNITKGNVVPMKATLVHDEERFPVAISTDISVRIYNEYRYIDAINIVVDGEEDGVIYFDIPDTLNSGTFGVEVKGKSKDYNWRTATDNVVKITRSTEKEEGSEAIPEGDTYDIVMTVQLYKQQSPQEAIDEHNNDETAHPYILNKINEVEGKIPVLPDHIVTDENYVHTDNNYTNEDKAKLAGLENYDDTQVRQLINEEKTARQRGDNALSESVTQEETRARGVEQSLQTSISNEATTREQAIETLDGKISANTQAITAERSRAESVEQALQLTIDTINGKIPAQATTQNQLADKEFVNSSVSTATADFKGTYNSLEDLEQVTANANDYAFVIATDQAGNTVYKRYKWVENTGWAWEYDLNNSSFTQAQWAAIQSGITAALVTKLSDLPDNSTLNQRITQSITTALLSYYTKSEIDSALGNKQDVIQDLANIRIGASAGATAVQPATLNSALSNTVAESGVYDVTANNDNAKFASLSALLSSENLNTLIPSAKRKGGMSIKFVLTSDNKYVQYRLLTEAFSINVDDWERYNDVTTSNQQDSDLDISDEQGNVLIRAKDGHIKTKNFDSSKTLQNGYLTYQRRNYFAQSVNTFNFLTTDFVAESINSYDEPIYYNDNVVLYLPESYSENKNPTKLIIYCKHGASTIEPSSDDILTGSMGRIFRYMLHLGYGILAADGVPNDWATAKKLGERAVGNYVAVESTIRAFEYVKEKYNIDHDNVYIFGYSQGGHYAQNVIDNSNIPIAAAAELSPVCSMRYHQWDLSASGTVDGVSYTKLARLNIARIFDFPAVANDTELLALEYDPTKTVGYDPWNRNVENMFTGFEKNSSDLWVLPNSTSLDDITMKKHIRCPLKIWAANNDNALGVDIMKVFIKAVKNSGQAADLQLYTSGAHSIPTYQSSIGTFIENGENCNLYPIALDIASWFFQFGGYKLV